MDYLNVASEMDLLSAMYFSNKGFNLQHVLF